MATIDAVQRIVSWSNKSEFERTEREEFHKLVDGREMLYAPVMNYKSFCSDMKHSTGRLMDFNKGT